jgi:ectoine hydroxylase-related dioxygenase (phytanoyl-CoA dioxygenase family)
MIQAIGNCKPVASYQLAKDGFEILDAVLPQRQCEVLADELTALHDQRKTSSKSRLGGLRNLIQLVPQVADIASSPLITNLLHSRLGVDAFPIRALFFDKTPDANWSVAWHQDLSIAVAEKIEAPGFEAWSVKESILHVQPPRQVLEQMLTVRLHLDDCNMDNGLLKVIPGSHLHGKLNAGQIADRTEEKSVVACEVRKGGALLMRPLLLHSSSPARLPMHRRVLHIEFATDELPYGLKWFERR